MELSFWMTLSIVVAVIAWVIYFAMYYTQRKIRLNVEKNVTSWLSLARRSSSIRDMLKYLEKFQEALATHDLDHGYDVWIRPTPQNDLAYGYDLLMALIEKCKNAVAHDLDLGSIEYQHLWREIKDDLSNWNFDVKEAAGLRSSSWYTEIPGTIGIISTIAAVILVVCVIASRI